ncbi:MAG: TonB-dependent receptor [Pseudomonadota bacterium]
MFHKKHLALLVGSCFLSNSLLAQQDEQTKEEQDTEIEKITVIGTNQSRYIVESNDALGINLDFLENPRSVSILPEQLILDRKITTLEEALRNVPGVVAGDGFGGTRDDFFLRGFRRNAEYRNGFRRASGGKANLSNVEYTQVVRGPAAIIYGQVEPGGVVDVITKRPLSSERFAGEFRAGSDSDYFGLLDWSKPINDKLGIRLVGSIRDSESFRDFTEIESDNLALTAEYEISDLTILNFTYEFEKDSRPLDRGTAFINVADGGQRVINDVADVPFSRRFGDPWENRSLNRDYFEVGIEHDFGNDWNVDARFAYEDASEADLQSRPLALFVLDENNPFVTADGSFTPTFFANLPEGVPVSTAILGFVASATQNVFDDPSDLIFIAKGLDGSRNRETEAYFANVRFEGEFSTGKLEHRISFGFDYRDSEQTRQFVRGAQTDGVQFAFLNILDPIYDLPDDFSLEGVPVDVFGPSEDIGAFVNSYTKINDKLGLLLGLRYSETESENTFAGRDTIVTDGDALTPQIGLTYQINETMSLYASYSESFEPQGDREGTRQASDGSAEEFIVNADPEEGEQFEIGVKAELFDGGLQFAAAVYRIEKTNVFLGDNQGATFVDTATNTLATEIIPFFSDGKKSQGFELSFSGQPTDGMNVVATYAYIDEELVNRGATNGNRSPSIPEHGFNLYASYEVQGGQFEGLGFGGGYYYESDRFGNTANTLELGGIDTLDASLWYTIAAPDFLAREDGTIRFQLAVKNILDEEFYLGGSNPLRIPLGAPRSYTASLSFDF